MKESKSINKKGLRVFILTFSMTLLLFGFLYGISIAYINSKNQMDKEQVTALDLQKTSYTTIEITVFDKTKEITISRDKRNDDLVIASYAAIPPEIRIIMSLLSLVPFFDS